MRLVELTKGKAAMIDDQDWAVVSRHSWHATPRGRRWYARSRIGGRKGRLVYMHVFITGVPGTDHRDRDGLNNTRANLRPCTLSQNAHNTPGRGGSSRFKGVCRKTGCNSWTASIRCDGRHYHLGSFRREEDAARAYDAAARRLHGEFGYLNFDPSATNASKPGTGGNKGLSITDPNTGPNTAGIGCGLSAPGDKAP